MFYPFLLPADAPPEDLSDEPFWIPEPFGETPDPFGSDDGDEEDEGFFCEGDD